MAADYYRTAAARRWADYCLAALTGTHGGGNGGEDKQKNTFDRLDATVTASLVLAPALPVRPKKEKKHTQFFFGDYSNYFLVLCTIRRVWVKTVRMAGLRPQPAAAAVSAGQILGIFRLRSWS